VITIRGESYRLREKRRAGLLGARADGAERARGVGEGEPVFWARRCRGCTSLTINKSHPPVSYASSPD